ncbi:MAG TPA: hypothetical protein ENK06_00760 [Gammaproteobacteria bacterium]|nr:hypothetical protein [Gammaproteobacteria bacterium]
MKRSLLTLCMLGAGFSVSAETAFLPMGENLTYGSVANTQSLISYTNNPATGSSALDKETGNFGMGIMASFGVGAEIGPVDNFVDQIDSLKKQLDDFSAKASPSIDDVEKIKSDFDGFLVDAGEKGRALVNAGLTAPFFPIVWGSRETLGGSLVIGASAAAQAQLRILDRPIEYNPLEQGDNILQTNSALYLKVGAVGEAGLTYSRPVFEMDEGALHAGIRGKYYQVGLRKVLIGINAMKKDAQKILEDELDNARDTDFQSGWGADLGVLWTAKNYRLGAWLKNANSPSFKYDAIGVNCDAAEDSDSCFIAKSFANEINLQETYTMDAQATFEGAVYSDNRKFVASFSADASPVNDPVGNQIQWLTVSAGYATTSWIIPGIRGGYRKNLAGSNLSAVTAGITLFKAIHVDAMYGLEKVEVDGNSAPRIVQLNVGVNLLF